MPIVTLLIEWADHYWYIAVLAFIYLLFLPIKRIDSLKMGCIGAAVFLVGMVHMGAAKLFLYFLCFAAGTLISEKTLLKYGPKCGVFFFAASTFWYPVVQGYALMDVYSKMILGLTGSLFFLWLIWSCTDSQKPDSLFSKIGQNTLIIYLTEKPILYSIYGMIQRQGFMYSFPLMSCMLATAALQSIVFALLIFGFERYPILRKILMKPSALWKFRLEMT